MAGYLIAEVWCDACGRRVVSDTEATLREHRAGLREDGWRRVRGDHNRNRWVLIDLCPDCERHDVFVADNGRPSDG